MLSLNLKSEQIMTIKQFMKYFHALKNFLTLNFLSLLKFFGLSAFLSFFPTLWYGIFGYMYNDIIRPASIIILLWSSISLIIDTLSYAFKKIKFKRLKRKREEIKQKKILERNSYIKSTIDNLQSGEIMLLKYILHAPTSVVHFPIDNPVVLALIDKKILNYPEYSLISMRGNIFGLHGECAPFRINQDFLNYIHTENKKLKKTWKHIPIARAMDIYQQNIINNAFSY